MPTINLLDKIRLNKGISALKAAFHDLINTDIKTAIDLVNDTNIQFPSLFVLQAEIRKVDLFSKLNDRNKAAFEFINNTKNSSSEFTARDFKILKWILESGYQEDGLNLHYEEIIEKAAIILAKVYKDKSCLNLIEEIIFNRHRKGAYIYDLVWAYFETSDHDCLLSLVKRLNSTNHKDLELVHKFLNFIPSINKSNDVNNSKLYHSSLKWLNENRKYLYYTGESSLQTHNPSRYSLSLEKKYLQKPISEKTDRAKQYSQEEIQLLNSFRELKEDKKQLLAEYSNILNLRNKNQWNLWIHSPIPKQIEIAKRMVGELI